MEREEIIMEECLALEHSLEETVGFQVLERGSIRVQAAGLQEVKFNLCLPLAQAIHILPDHFQVAHLAEADLQAITLMQVSAPMARLPLTFQVLRESALEIPVQQSV